MSNEGIRPRSGGNKATTQAAGQQTLNQPGADNFANSGSQEQRRPIGAGNLRGTLRTGNSRRPVGETVSQYKDTLLKALKDSNYPETKVFVLDGPSNNLRLSSLVVALPMDIPGGGQMVAAYTIIIEASQTTSMMPKQDINIGGATIQIPLTPGEVFNKGYSDKVLELVAGNFPGYDVRGATGMVLYREVASTDDKRMKEVAFYATEACVRTIDLLTGAGLFGDFSLGMLNPSDRTKAYLTFNPVVEDVCGLPVRADIGIEITAEPAVQTDKYNPVIDPLITVFGYTELMYYPLDQQQANGQYWGQAPTQRYVPRFNITKMMSAIDVETLEMRLFGIYSTLLLWTSNAWSHPLRPSRTASDRVNLRDITAVGFETPAYCKHNGGKPDRVRGASDIFTDQDFAGLLREAVDPNYATVAIHLEECGEMTWLDSVLWQAANGVEQSVLMVVRALNNLTNDGFSKYFDVTRHALFTVDNNRMIRGYRNDMTNRHDLLEIDSLAMLNINGASDLGAAVDYDKTFIDSSALDANGRMAQRYKQQVDLLGDTMEVKAYGLRIVCTNELLLAIDHAVSDMNFNILPTNVFDYGLGAARGTAVRDIGRTAIAAQNLGGVFRNRQSSNNSGGLNSGLTWGARRG